MKYLLLPTLFTLLPPLASAQTLISPTLPSCAQQCSVLQQAQTACIPAGGAPVSDQATYQSCFCQSNFLTQLQSPSPVQLCSSCSASDMAAIQSWFKATCQPGAANNGPTTTPSITSSSTTAPTTFHVTSSPTVSPTTSAASNNQDPNSINADQTDKPWMTTHWRWIVMLIALAIGLALVALCGWLLHRRYHRRREAQWSQAVGSQPDITTWGPGQSVHDFGVAGLGMPMQEKGKAREQVRGMNEPVPARMREHRLSKF